MSIGFICLLLPFAATCGWISGRKSKKTGGKKNTSVLRGDVFRGLNYLINEEPDKAVDVFIQLLDIDSDTVEIHLALGALFRRRGEISRAVRIHQNLIARPHLSNESRMASILALAKDYLASGVLDRAENLLLELIKYGYDKKYVLDLLIEIYQQEKDWVKAIQIARKIQSKYSVSMVSVITQFYCELAQNAIALSQLSEAMVYIDQALAIDKKSVRGILLKAGVEVSQGRYSNAIKWYKVVETHQIERLFEVLPTYCHCYLKCDKKVELKRKLQRMLAYSPEYFLRSSDASVLTLVQDLDLISSSVLDALDERPSLFGLYLSLKFDSQFTHSLTSSELSEKVQRGLHVLMGRQKQYQCSNCGFSVQDLLWLCPGCQRWDSMCAQSVLDHFS